MRLQNNNPLLTDPRSNSSDNAEFKLFLKMAEFAPMLGVDTESNGEDLRDGRGHSLGVSIAFSHDGINGYSYYFPFRHEIGENLNWSYRDRLKDLIESKPITCHNLKHDILALKSLGINVNDDASCSMLLAHNVNENYLSYSLDSLARNVVGIPGKMRDDDFKLHLKAFGWAGLPVQSAAPYAARDAELHLEVHNYFKPLYDKEDESDGERWQTEMDYVRLLIKMESQGARVDLDLAERQISLGELRMTELTDEIGYNPGSRNDLEQLLVHDLKLPIFDGQRTEAGNLSFSKKYMEQYEEILQYMDNPVARNVLEYRGYQKAVSSYWKAYLRLVSPDGRVRPNFKQHGTKTSRLSCEEPNLQQIPRITTKPWNKRVKAGFLPRDAYRLWEPDYSQLEMRLQAAYAKELKLLAIFADDNRDLFNEMSADLGLPRYDTKQLNYAIGYGAQPRKIAMMLGKSESQATGIFNDYFGNYPGLHKLFNMASNTVEGQGFIRYWTTRRRHFEFPRSEKYKGLNSVMQGGAAELIKRVQLRLDKEIDPECLQILQVHDAVVFEIPEGREKVHLPEIRRVMEDIKGLPTKPDFGVNFKVDIHEWGK